MARGREGIAKRERERVRQQRQEEKRQRRETIAAEAETPDGAHEARLMEEFRTLSEQHASGTITAATYDMERHRIFVELGIEQDEA